MTGFDIYSAVGGTDEKFLEESETPCKRKINFLPIASVAACVAIIAAGVYISMGSDSQPDVTYEITTAEISNETTVTDITVETFGMTTSALPNDADGKTNQDIEKISSAVSFGGMSFEGLMAYDISELSTPDPWNAEMELSSLPVYRNLSYSPELHSVGCAFYLSEEQMNETAENIAAALNTEIISKEPSYVGDIYGNDLPDEIENSILSLDAKCSGDISITVHGDGQIRILFKNKEMPSGYNFTYNNTTAAEAEEVLEYLSEEFSNLLQYDDPVCYSYAERTFSGEENRSYYVYNKAEDPVQDILNFNLTYASFAPNDDGDLLCIWLNDPLCSSEYIGDYPVITAEEATDLLLNGKYYSSVPDDYIRNGIISADDIAKTELIYRDSRHEEYHQPYYRFYVELDTGKLDSADGLKIFGIFYVPAVNAEYLNDFNVNISFN